MQLCSHLPLPQGTHHTLLLDKDLVTEQAGLGGHIGVWQAFGKSGPRAQLLGPSNPRPTHVDQRRGGAATNFPKAVHKCGTSFLILKFCLLSLSSEGFNIQNLSLKLQSAGQLGYKLQHQ